MTVAQLKRWQAGGDSLAGRHRAASYEAPMEKAKCTTKPWLWQVQHQEIEEMQQTPLLMLFFKLLLEQKKTHEEKKTSHLIL